MAIVPLVKVTLCGPAADMHETLDGLQSLGCLHLIDLGVRAAEPDESGDVDRKAREALQYLGDSPVRRRTLRQSGDVDTQTVIAEALGIRDRARALAEERAQLQQWIADLEPWGDFELPAWAEDGPLRFWFYIVPQHQAQRVGAMPSHGTIVAQDHRFAYAVVIAAEQPRDMPVAPVQLERRSIAKLRSRLDEVERELEALDYRRIGLTLYTEVLKETLDESDDRAARRRAAAHTLERDQLFAVQGWAPLARTAELRQLTSERRLALTSEAPGAGDKPPTLLHNAPALSGGEGLVEFYMTPAYRLWDPSRAVFFAFALFFGMILSDAGYGVVLGAALLAAWRRLGRSPGGRSSRGVFLALVLGSVIYGVLVGTYFGMVPPRGSWLDRLHVLDTDDQRLMMWIAIGVGVAHLCYASLVTAWWRRHSATALSALGWAGIFLGGFCAGLANSFPGLAPLGRAGPWMLGFGGLLVLLFTSEKPFSLEAASLFGRLADGLKGITNLSKAFGDALSYLRLFALGLASIKLAEAFNGLAATSFHAGGIGLLLGLAVLLIGHGINFAMGIMSGVVHGLRLNLIEFFNWSLPEEGEPFRSFKKRAPQAAV